MKKIGLFFGTDTGNTETVAENMVESLKDLTGQDIVDLQEVYQKKSEDMAAYNYLILGQPTWYDGELQGDWEEFLPELKKIDFKGKKVALFGLGDQYGYASYFCDALGIYADIIESQGGELVGFTSVEGYEHDYSKAQREDQFVGLCLDVDNEDELTEERVDKWLPDVIKAFDV
jgi:flavodoxin I